MFVPLKTRFRIITRTYFAASRIVSRDKSIEQNIQEWSTRRKKSSLHGMRIKPMILHHNYIYSSQSPLESLSFDIFHQWQSSSLCRPLVESLSAAGGNAAYNWSK